MEYINFPPVELFKNENSNYYKQIVNRFRKNVILNDK